jgi:hypothetical protein
MYSDADFPASKHTLQKGLPLLRAASWASDGLDWVWYIAEVDLISLLHIAVVGKAIQFFFTQESWLDFKILKMIFFLRF